MINPVCKRCGQCCYLIGSNKKCKHLILLPSGLTLCRIYKTRLGADCGNGIRCIERDQDGRLFQGCPYNKI